MPSSRAGTAPAFATSPREMLTPTPSTPGTIRESATSRPDEADDSNSHVFASVHSFHSQHCKFTKCRALGKPWHTNE